MPVTPMNLWEERAVNIITELLEDKPLTSSQVYHGILDHPNCGKQVKRCITSTKTVGLLKTYFQKDEQVKNHRRGKWNLVWTWTLPGN